MAEAWYPNSCAMRGCWIILPWKFNFLQLVPTTTQRHGAQCLLEKISNTKEKTGNAGKLALIAAFKEMTEREHILLYIMLFLIQNTIVRPSPASPLWWREVWTGAKVFFIQSWNIHTMVSFLVNSYRQHQAPLSNWNMLGYGSSSSSSRHHFKSVKRKRKNPVKKLSFPRKQLEIILSDIFWKAITPDYEELQSEQETRLNSGSAVHDTTILCTFEFKSTIWTRNCWIRVCTTNRLHLRGKQGWLPQQCSIKTHFYHC